MTFNIPLMFLACLQWAPPSGMVEGFHISQPLTIIADGTHLTLKNNHVDVYRISCDSTLIAIHHGIIDDQGSPNVFNLSQEVAQ